MALVQKQFSDLITFTRSSAGGRFNERGLFEMVPANQPRFDYDPITRQPLGLLIEESRTNLTINSANLGAWVKRQVTTLGQDFIDGSKSAILLTAESSNGWHQLTGPSFNVEAGKPYTCTVYAKNSGKNICRVTMEGPNFIISQSQGKFDLSSGTILAGSGPNTLIRNVGNGWFRLTISGVATATGNANMALGVGEVAEEGNALVGIIYGGPQTEQASFETSYIPTTASQVTRVGDSATVNNFNPWYNKNEGAIYVDYSPGHIGNGLTCVGVYMSSDNPTRDIVAIRNGVGQGNIDGIVIALSALNLPDRQARPRSATGIPVGANVRSAMALKQDSVSMSTNGGASVTDNTVDMPTPTLMGIGRATSNQQYANGHIRSIRYYPRRLTDTELQDMTK